MTRDELVAMRARGHRLTAEMEERLFDHEQQDAYQCWSCGAYFVAPGDPADDMARKREEHHARHAADDAADLELTRAAAEASDDRTPEEWARDQARRMTERFTD